MVNLVASTSGSDSDWVVKLIDVFPDEVQSQPEMGGYQLAIGMDIFRTVPRKFCDCKSNYTQLTAHLQIHFAHGE